jgi:hypothetical protein
MKCIKSKADGTIKRVTDTEAFQLVGSKWEYAPKSMWKGTTRTEPVAEPVTVEEPTISEKQLKRKK